MKNTKIALFMIPLLTHGGGAEKYFIELANNLSERGIITDVITMDKKFYGRYIRLVYILRYFNFVGKIKIFDRETEKSIESNLGRSRWKRISFKNLKNVLNGYDVVYTKNEIFDLLLLKLIGYRNLPPIIVGVHTPIYYSSTKSLSSKLHNLLYTSFFYKWLLNDVKCIHVSNIFTENLIKKVFKLKSVLIHYPFDIKHITENVKKYRPNILYNSKKINVVYVGRLSEQKGTDILMNIIVKLSKHQEIVQKINLSIFGSGGKSFEEKLTELSKVYFWVKYYGHLENNYIPGILSKQNLLITPSRWETLPYNVLEAQALGIPVVAFDIPGPNDIIVNGVTGYLVKNENEFFEKIKKFSNSKSIFDKHEIINNIESKFNPGEITDKLITMFKKISILKI